MVNVVFVSLYLRTDEYPQKYTLSSMRLASYIMSREDVNVRIIPSKYDMTDCEIEELAETLDGMNINILGLSAYPKLDYLTIQITFYIIPKLD